MRGQRRLTGIPVAVSGQYYVQWNERLRKTAGNAAEGMGAETARHHDQQGFTKFIVAFYGIHMFITVLTRARQ